MINQAHIVAFALFCIFEIFSLLMLLYNYFMKKKASLNLFPATFFFIVFLYFNFVEKEASLFWSLTYLILLFIFNFFLGFLNTKLIENQTT